MKSKSISSKEHTPPASVGWITTVRRLPSLHLHPDQLREPLWPREAAAVQASLAVLGPVPPSAPSHWDLQVLLSLGICSDAFVSGETQTNLPG